MRIAPICACVNSRMSNALVSLRVRFRVHVRRAVHKYTCACACVCVCEYLPFNSLI